MKTRYPTASKLRIARRCLYPWVDGVEWRDDDGSSFAAMRGTFAHRFIAAALDSWCSAPDVDPSDSAAVEGRRLADVALAWWRDVAHLRNDWSNEPRCEGTFSCDVRGECECHGRMRREDYPQDRIVGTADAYWFDDDGALHVLDWKTGSAQNTEDVDDNAQLRGLTAMIAGWYGADTKEAHLHLAFITEDGVTLRSSRMTAGELSAARAELTDMVWDLGERASRNTPQSGAHCRYCPVRSCSARDGAVDALDVASDATTSPHRLSEEITGPDHAAWLVEHLAVAEDVLDKVKARLREYADANGGVRLPNGKVWARREVVVEKIADDPRVVERVKFHMLDGALKTTTSRAAIEREAKAMGVSASDLLNELYAGGLIVESTSARYEARKEKP